MDFLQDNIADIEKNKGRFLRKTIWGAPAEAGLTRSNNLKRRHQNDTTNNLTKASMKIKELQQRIADALNGCEELVQGGCKAIVEDSQTVIDDVQRHTATVRGVAVVVTTPDFSLTGSNPDGLPVQVRVVINCIEIPELSRKRAGNLTALDAAELIAAELDSGEINFVRIAQSADTMSRSITATAEFVTSVFLN